MAITNVFIDETKPHARLLRRGLANMEEGFEILNDVLANVPHMIDGDGSDAAHFTEVTSRYGFTSNDVAKSAWDELNSAMSKLNTNGSVSSVNAALLQLFNKFR